MDDKAKKKDLTEYEQTKSKQLELFELDVSLKSYSNSIELYDSMPKYYVGGVEREKGNKVESLPVLQREFVHRNREYKVQISPAAVLDKKSGKTIYYYPSQREELVEEALRKIATMGGAKDFGDNKSGMKIGVVFSYYRVQQELIRAGHGYSIEEIKLAIEILNKASMEITTKDGNEISITSSYFTFVGKETKELGGKEKVAVTFHSLVTKSINEGSYRLFNYDRLMQLKMSLSRWLHKKISHMFSQATVNNPYTIKLSTIVLNSGMKSYSTISERRRQVEKSFAEMKKAGIIDRFEADLDREKNKILDIKYSLYMSEEFVKDAKKANSTTNLRLDNADVRKEREALNLDELRQEIEKPIYGLSKTVINNYLANISTPEQYFAITESLEAVKDYIATKKAKGEKVNNAALTRAAIRDGWTTKEEGESQMKVVSKTPEEVQKEKKEVDEKKRKETERHQELQNNPAWLKIRKAMKGEYDNGEDDSLWQKWFLPLECFSMDASNLILSAPTKFVRDWVIREFLDKNPPGQKSLKVVIKAAAPDIKKISVIFKSESSD